MQAEAAAIGSEQASQAMEARYSALMDAHGKAVADKEKLHKENESLREVGGVGWCGLGWWGGGNSHCKAGQAPRPSADWHRRRHALLPLCCW